MKYFSFISAILLVYLFSPISDINPTVAFEDCDVVSKVLKGNYEGDCKKGLAHGTGKAVGLDTYEGKWKKGNPHGLGVYTYANGDRYEGKFKNGLRHGKGKFFKSGSDKAQVIETLWAKDEYVRDYKKKRNYKIKTQRNISTLTVNKTKKERNRIEIFVRHVNDITNVDITATNNYNEFQSGGDPNRIVLENVEYPNIITLNYQTPGHMNSYDIRASMVIEFFEEGEYLVNIRQ